LAQALRSIDPDLKKDALQVTQDPSSGLALSLQGFDVIFKPGSPFEDDLKLALSFKISGAANCNITCSASGWLKMHNGEAPGIDKDGHKHADGEHPEILHHLRH